MPPWKACGESEQDLDRGQEVNRIQSMSLQTRLRHLLEVADLSAREASRLAGHASPNHFAMILRGEITEPRIDTAGGIADAFGVSLEWLAFGKGDAPDPAAVRAAVEAARARAVAEAAEHTPTKAAA
jgi:transcriptional regulator with XRE-family HTH domain